MQWPRHPAIRLPSPMAPEPFTQLLAWYRAAQADESIRYPDAACLATVDSQGHPDARIVLVHQLGADGFLFSTDSRSPKAQQLATQPRAALTFYWESQERQVRIRGLVHPGSEREAEECFAERPRGSRVTPWASRQSAEFGHREALEQRYRDSAEQFAASDPVPRPQTWTAFRLQASSIEFWQASRHRLHRRQLYELQSDSSWRRQLLEP